MRFWPELIIFSLTVIIVSFCLMSLSTKDPLTNQQVLDWSIHSILIVALGAGFILVFIVSGFRSRHVWKEKVCIHQPKPSLVYNYCICGPTLKTVRAFSKKMETMFGLEISTPYLSGRVNQKAKWAVHIYCSKKPDLEQFNWFNDQASFYNCFCDNVVVREDK